MAQLLKDGGVEFILFRDRNLSVVLREVAEWADHNHAVMDVVIFVTDKGWLATVYYEEERR